eukprot:scaffold461_cov131-Isochrysis_galbana.AAC.4
MSRATSSEKVSCRRAAEHCHAISSCATGRSEFRGRCPTQPWRYYVRPRRIAPVLRPTPLSSVYRAASSSSVPTARSSTRTWKSRAPRCRWRRSGRRS